ncbi:putative ribonuclease H-like domain-containing protein [Tanacetum coccineum]
MARTKSGSTTLERKKDPNDFNLSAPNSHHEDEELSSDKDVDEWLNAEMSKRMTRQDKEEEEDALIDILKIVLPPKEMNPGSFTLSCTIGNLKLYVMTDLGAGVNVMPKSLFEHFQLADLKETSMVVEMADMTKKAPLGIMENILVKIDKFMFHFDFVVIDMLKGLNETMILGRPFLATIHAQIDVFRREILLGIGEEKVNFDMNGGICHSRELEGSQDDEVGSHLLENVVSRWHVCKPVRITFVDCEKDCGQWPTCNPDLRFCSGYDAIYGQEKVRCSIRYGNKNINDVTRERRYYEWVAHNYDFNVKSRRATEYADPYYFHHEYPYSYIPQKSDSPPNDTLRINTYFPDVFQTQLKKLRMDKSFPSLPPYVKPAQPLTKDTHEPLEKDPNEFNLSAPNSHHEDEDVSSDEDVDEVWEKCEKFHDTTKL